MICPGSSKYGLPGFATLAAKPATRDQGDSGGLNATGVQPEGQRRPPRVPFPPIQPVYESGLAGAAGRSRWLSPGMPFPVKVPARCCAHSTGTEMDSRSMVSPESLPISMCVVLPLAGLFSEPFLRMRVRSGQRSCTGAGRESGCAAWGRCLPLNPPS